MTNALPILLIHGGAGNIQRDTMTPERLALFKDALFRIAVAGQNILQNGGSALDAVTHAVCLLENNELFNAGKGSVFTKNKTHEMDAAIMDGQFKTAGAVACVSHIKNPILAARAVMEHSPHVCLVGQGADSFAQQQGLTLVPNHTFSTPERTEQFERSQSKLQLDHDAERSTRSSNTQNPICEDEKHGTVGAVALDMAGHLAAATSTGGLMNKTVGRVGDTPIIGAGCYADELCAVSCTGTGEAFIRRVIAYDIAARMHYGQESLEDAARHAIQINLEQVKGHGGVIAIDRDGNFTLPMNTQGMYRALAIGKQTPVAKVFKDD